MMTRTGACVGAATVMIAGDARNGHFYHYGLARLSTLLPIKRGRNIVYRGVVTTTWPRSRLASAAGSYFRMPRRLSYFAMPLPRDAARAAAAAVSGYFSFAGYCRADRDGCRYSCASLHQGPDFSIITPGHDGARIGFAAFHYAESGASRSMRGRRRHADGRPAPPRLIFATNFLAAEHRACRQLASGRPRRSSCPSSRPRRGDDDDGDSEGTPIAVSRAAPHLRDYHDMWRRASLRRAGGFRRRNGRRRRPARCYMPARRQLAHTAGNRYADEVAADRCRRMPRRRAGAEFRAAGQAHDIIGQRRCQVDAKRPSPSRAQSRRVARRLSRRWPAGRSRRLVPRCHGPATLDDFTTTAPSGLRRCRPRAGAGRHIVARLRPVSARSQQEVGAPLIEMRR